MRYEELPDELLKEINDLCMKVRQHEERLHNIDNIMRRMVRDMLAEEKEVTSSPPSGKVDTLRERQGVDLGDSVYARLEDGCIVLTTDSGSKIYLEPEVASNLAKIITGSKSKEGKWS